jgi:hypothetical protein
MLIAIPISSRGEALTDAVNSSNNFLPMTIFADYCRCSKMADIPCSGRALADAPLSSSDDGNQKELTLSDQIPD